MATEDDKAKAKSDTEAEAEETQEEEATEDESAEADDTGDDAEGESDDKDEEGSGSDDQKTGLSALLDEDKPDVELEVPEGIDPRVAAGVSAFASEHGLSNEQAAALLKRESDGFRAYVNQVEDGYVAELETALKADPVLGGSNLGKTAMKVDRVLTAIDATELRQALDHPAWGYNKVLLGAFVALHDKFIAEDEFVESRRPPKKPEKPKTLAERLFPDAKRKAG